MVEHYFERTPKGDIRIAGETRILWDEGALPSGTIHLHEHVAAVRINLGDHDLSAFKKMPRRRPKPKPGESLPVAHYRAVLDAYQALVASGESRPTAKLAERYGTNRNTIKSWLRRGRIYLSDSTRGG